MEAGFGNQLLQCGSQFQVAGDHGGHKPTLSPSRLLRFVDEDNNQAMLH